jgi:acetyl esterase/lipase
MTRPFHVPQYVWLSTILVFVLVVTYARFGIKNQSSEWGQSEAVVEQLESQPTIPEKCAEGDAMKVLLGPREYPGTNCIDGTPPAYYYRKGHGTGSDKWLVYFEGGGWCYNLTQCAYRAQTDLGSSSKYPDCITADKMKFYISPL